MNTLDILKQIIQHDDINRNECTIMITGRVGPTGKTWLCDQLNKLGYKAFELTLRACDLFNDDGVNHFIVDTYAKQVLVVLNEILPMYSDKWSRDSNTILECMYWFESSDDAERVRRIIVEIAEKYGVVSRSDLMDEMGLKSNFDDIKRGWTKRNIYKSRIVAHRNGYLLELPITEKFT